MTWWLALAALAAILAAPWLIEMMRKRSDPVALAAADGEFAVLSHGATYYRWFGAGHGPVLVMIHGLLTPSWVFTGLTGGLNMLGFRVLTYDLYGRGLSARPKLPHDRALFTTQLAELLASQKIDAPVTLLGYSMGGAIASVFAATYPQRVARLILLAPAGMDYHPAPLLARAARTGLFGDWLWAMRGGPFLRKNARASASQPTTIPDLEARIARESATRGYLPAILSSERNMLAERHEAEHRAIAAAGLPVTAIWGEQDGTIPLSAMGKLPQWTRNAYQYVIPGATHALCHTHPQEILTALEEHLREV
ncbi:MAG TPA: alpha/beta hydrolase [Aliiroseovarius sp.]|nr:alpha/beta hydrolase [Aliiroseovarius sp.]